MNVPRPELVLSELTAADLPFLFELWHKPEVMHYRIMELTRERFEELYRQ